MWCAKCHADVAAEVTPDNARARCATCGSELGMAAAVRAADKTREARALLERWSANRALDPFGPVAPSRAVPGDSLPTDKTVSRVSPAPQPAPAPEPAVAAESLPEAPPKNRDAAAASSRDRAASERSRRLRIDDAQVTADDQQSVLDEFEAAPPRQPRMRAAITSEHIDVRSAILDSGARRTNWFQLAGHLLAYAGALILTVGMALVLVGCFGGPAKVHFTPTGWLIATFGQLLLVSGAITLLSSGMERTTREVSQQIEALGDKLLRIDASGHRAPPRPLGSAAAPRRRRRVA